jgi:hypothetical protein
MLQNIHEMVCESKIAYGIEVWGLSVACKEYEKVQSRLCKKSMVTLNCAVNGFAEMELGRQKREVQGRIVIHWLSDYVFVHRRSGRTVLRNGRRVKRVSEVGLWS